MATKNGLQNQLRTLHIVSSLILAALAVVSVFVMKTTSYPVAIAHTTKNELASQTTTVFAPAMHTLINVEVRYVLATILGLAALFSLLVATYWYDKYHKQLQGRHSPLTWLGLGGVIPALMVETVAWMSGIQDFITLKLLAGLTVLAAILCWLAERNNKNARNPQLLHYWLALAVGLFTWFWLMVSLLMTSIYGGVRLPWFQYGLYLIIAAASLGAYYNLWCELKKRGDGNFWQVERNYLLINLAAKTSFAALLIIGLKK